MIRQIILYLQEKPMVGMASGAGGALFAFIESSAKIVGAIGAWAGAAVAVLTAVSKIIEIRNNLKSNKKP